MSYELSELDHILVFLDGWLANFKAPMQYSYTNPNVKIIKKKITIQNPIIED